jgi:predicted nucleotidyltransferase
MNAMGEGSQGKDLLIFVFVKSQDIITTLRSEMPKLKRDFGVEEIGLFGSAARNEANAASDVDVLVKLENPSFIKLAGLLNYLENLLHTKVDITTKHKHLSPRFLKSIERDIVYA